jgi:hypothetical protein
VIAGFALSSVMGMHLVAEMHPTQDIVKGLHVLSGISPGLTLSHPSYGSAIAIIGQHKVFADELDGPNVSEAVDQMLQSFRLTNATVLLDAEGIDYIFITKDMREGLVWNRTDPGLLLLIQHKQYFSSLYRDSHVEILAYSGAVIEQ